MHHALKNIHKSPAVENTPAVFAQHTVTQRQNFKCIPCIRVWVFFFSFFFFLNGKCGAECVFGNLALTRKFVAHLGD